MTELDILEQFDQENARFALVATYEFDPTFFERRVLRTKSFGSADRIVVFMDHGRYQELIAQGRVGSGFNRDYLVVPIHSQRNVFHPKIYLTLGDRRVTGLIGSSNCTNAGIAYNLELCSSICLRLDADGAVASLEAALLRRLYEACRLFAEDTATLGDFLDRSIFRPIEEQCRFLDRNVRPGPGRSDIEVLLSLGPSTIWEQVHQRLHGQDIQKILVLAPFFDPDLALIKRFRTQWPQAQIKIVAQPGYSNLPPLELQRLFDAHPAMGDRLLAADAKPGRRLHAKCFAFTTSDVTFWLTGSANATLAAFDSKNTEACLWFAASDPPDAILTGPDLSTRPLPPLDFEPGSDEEPAVKKATGDAVLRLDAVSLDEAGIATVTLSSVRTVRDATLRFQNARENDPFLVLSIKGLSAGVARLGLEPDQLALFRSVVLCDVKAEVDGQQVVSNRVALAQLGHLAMERNPGETARNKLQKVHESGEHLVEMMDGFGNAQDAIEFLSHLSIRFNDGDSGRSQFIAGGWKARDPYQGDTPHEWFVVHGGSAQQLRAAIWEFVGRHQKRQLARHIRGGNVNGLRNFLDIFRTLNGLLLTFHARLDPEGKPIIPHAFVTEGIKKNLALLIGPPPGQVDDDADDNYLDAIRDNLGPDRGIMNQRLAAEKMPEMLRAAVEAMVHTRRRALKLKAPDTWTVRHLGWVSQMIADLGLPQPTEGAVQEAGAEYPILSSAA